jgi:DNA-binding Lrp family transcriptional regulator
VNAGAPAVHARPDALDRRLIEATQAGLPLVPRPFHALAAQLGLEPGEVLARFECLVASGAIRRIAAVPNHYAVGYSANAMCVWDVPDGDVAAVGEELARLAFVTHCYERPRAGPDWPYNLFVMLHGRSRAEVEELRARVQAVIGERARAAAVLYSTRILKKTGFRLGSD